jgi:beta-glucanase (GH16 family)
MFYHFYKRAVDGWLLFVFFVSNIYAGGWRLFWSDEFDSTALKEQYWTVRVAPPRWVNNEEQRYTAGHDVPNSNIFVKNGFLIIEARKTNEITSGRIEGGGKKTFMYGRMEARMRLPKSQGYWPAFWMLGVGGGWPSCGEIDIMEGKGQQLNWTSGAFHSAQGTPVLGGNYTLPSNVGNVHDSFHIYAIEWSEDSIRWYFDKVNFMTLTKARYPGVPINKEYYFILNVAVGGNFPGPTNSSTIFPESLIVDYVRVYKWDPALKTENEFSKINKSEAFISIKNSLLEINIPYNENKYVVEIYLPSGKKVFNIQLSKKFFKIPLDFLVDGLYVVKVSGKFGKQSKKIIVQK